VRKISISTVLILTAALVGSAWAQVEGEETTEGEVEAGAEGEAEVMPPPDAPPPPGTDGAMEGKPPMILAQGKLSVVVPVGINMSASAVAKPIAIAPDVWYGVMPKLEVGVAHSNEALTGFWFQGLGGGVCVTGESSGCPKLYNGPIGVLAHFTLMEGSIDLAADGGLVTTLDPMALSLKAGVRGRWMSGKIAVHFSPGIGIGLTERDSNKEEIFVPVSVGYMVSPKLHAAVQTGIFGPLDGFGDAFAIPVGVGALFGVNDKIMVGGAFTFWNLAGKGSSADFRDLTLVAMWHN
jgi:hypothetical protein